MASELEKIVKILDGFGTKLQEDIKKSLIKHKHADDSGQVGMTYRYQVRGGKLYLMVSDYFDYLDKGTRSAKSKGSGGNKMAKSLTSWISRRSKLRGIVQDIQMNYKDKDGNKKKRKKSLPYKKAENQAAWMLKKSINKKGIIARYNYKGSGFFTKVINDGRMKLLSELITKEIGREINIQLISNSSLLAKKI